MSEIFRYVGAPARRPLLSVLLSLSACISSEVTTGIVNDRLRSCPDSPNCVSSDATDEEHRVEPYRLKTAPRRVWHELQNVVTAEERSRLIAVDDRYLHVEFRSAVFRFVDDTEFHLRASEGIIAVRSAARTGHGDFDVNRKRVDRIREALRARKLIE